MGPPKARPPRLKYAEVLTRYDTFEQRIDVHSGQQYLVNNYTGETVFGTDTGLVDRTKSMWMPVDRRTRAGIVIVHMYPCYYQSRRWGRRPFEGWSSPDAAATMIAAATRGYQARLALRKYFNRRYFKRPCQFSGYFYFYDTLNEDPNVETKWYKPILAFPDDIDEYVEDDPEDYMKGGKKSNLGFERGPYTVREGIQKHKLARAKTQAFIKPDPRRTEALTKVDEIDIDKTPLGSVIAWMDGAKTVSLYIDDYTNMRVAAQENNWKLTLHFMELYKSRPLSHVYALQNIAKMKMEIEKDGGMSMECASAFALIMELVDDPYGRTPMTIKVFALYAMERFLGTVQGRSEFFDLKCVKAQGKKRAKAVEEYLKKQFRIFTRIIDSIEMEKLTMKSKHEGVHDEVVLFPSRRGVDMAELGLSCLSLLGQEQEWRELMSELVVKSIMTCMMKCIDEPLAIINGLKALYNLCYRCNAGQVTILLAPYKKLLEAVYGSFSGDPEVNKMTRRLELALTGDGWRGTVEATLAEEMAVAKAKADAERKAIRLYDERQTTGIAGFKEIANEDEPGGTLGRKNAAGHK
jgi:hypothetical protein